MGARIDAVNQQATTCHHSREPSSLAAPETCQPFCKEGAGIIALPASDDPGMGRNARGSNGANASAESHPPPRGVQA